MFSSLKVHVWFKLTQIVLDAQCFFTRRRQASIVTLSDSKIAVVKAPRLEYGVLNEFQEQVW